MLICGGLITWPKGTAKIGRLRFTVFSRRFARIPFQSLAIDEPVSSANQLSAFGRNSSVKRSLSQATP
jgi:hypothetical protein